MRGFFAGVLGALALALLGALALPGAGRAQDDGYRIRPGDVLKIEVLEDTSLNRSVLVPPDGRITVPLAGSVETSGRTTRDVQAALAGQLQENFAVEPHVYVSIERLAERAPATGTGVAGITVYVLGESAKPGALTVPRGTTVLQLFATTGGFSKFAATKRIQLRRTGKDGTETIYRVDYDAIQRGTSAQGKTTLVDGDVILIPQRRLFE